MGGCVHVCLCVCVCDRLLEWLLTCLPAGVWALAVWLAGWLAFARGLPIPGASIGVTRAPPPPIQLQFTKTAYDVPPALLIPASPPQKLYPCLGGTPLAWRAPR